MEFIKLTRSSSGTYIYEDASNIAMNILGNFLCSDVYNIASFKEYANNESENYTAGNLTSLEKKMDVYY